MNKKYILIALVAVLVAGAVGYVAFFKVPTQTTPEPTESPSSSPIACTQEAKQCSDGSYVGRTGPNCEFAPCPTLPPTPPPPGSECSSDYDCGFGYVCIQRCGPPVARENDPPPPYYCETKANAANRICPICLAGNTLIDTPSGSMSVKDLQIGMPIWTIDKAGHRVSGVVQKTSRVPVLSTHQMVHLVLDDGRELFVSPGHPTIDERNVGDLAPGDLYNGTSVVNTERVPYGEGATYDILPSGETGFYWANGILLDSTLH